MVTEEAERDLALQLLGFGAAVEQVAEAAEPHRLCAYVFETASLFTTFYEQCPVLKADNTATRESRLALCAATLRVLTTGYLGLLGVPLPRAGCKPRTAAMTHWRCPGATRLRHRGKLEAILAGPPALAFCYIFVIDTGSWPRGGLRAVRKMSAS